jgi:hypothetical protein
MSTIYNISLQVENIKDKLVTPEGAKKIVKIFEDAGLTGEKHVDNIGRVYSGYDKNCEDYLTGEYNIFVRNRPEFKGKSMREIVNFGKLTQNKFNYLLKEAEMEETIEETLDALEKVDPLARDMPMDMYFEVTFIDSFSINTPVGKQDTHVHTPEGGIIQFWRPKGLNRLYDFDAFKGYLFDAHSDFSEYYGVRRLFYELKINQAFNLYHKLMINPDNMNKKDFSKLWLVKNLQKIV